MCMFWSVGVYGGGWVVPGMQPCCPLTGLVTTAGPSHLLCPSSLTYSMLNLHHSFTATYSAYHGAVKPSYFIRLMVAIHFNPGHKNFFKSSVQQFRFIRTHIKFSL